MRLFLMALMVSLFGFVASVSANDSVVSNSEVEQQLMDRFQQLLPGIAIAGIEKSPLDGFYEIFLVSGERVFSRPGMDFFMVGDLFQSAENGLVNLTGLKRDKSRAERITKVDEVDKITFSPVDKKASVTVFTDVDCGFCRKLHLEMDQYLEAGIEINYLAYPRAGVGSASYNKIVNAWCAEDKQDAMTRLKTGRSVESVNCDNPVAAQFKLAREMGVTGTPAIITESGRIISGYRSAAVLAEMLGL